MTRAALATAFVLTTLMIAGAASAQTLDQTVANLLRVEWERVPDRPGIEGYVYNDSSYRIGLVRLTILGRDAPTETPTSTLAWVYGNVPARGRWYFRARVPSSREVLSVSIESFHLIAQDPPPSQSP